MLRTVQTVLVTGGAGYIGSHVCVELLLANYDLVIVDNLSNSYKNVLSRIKKITQKSFSFYDCDILDKKELEFVFSRHSIDQVIHLAGRKSVPESVEFPLAYYQANIIGLLNILESVELCKTVKKIVFSSSAAVYGDVDAVKIIEDLQCCPKSPYGTSKLFCEKILTDFCQKYDGRNHERRISAVILRYFNPVGNKAVVILGAHQTGLIGEDPIQSCIGLMPLLEQVIFGKRTSVNIYGSDYNTKDGSGCRDFIHIMDIASAHKLALDFTDIDQYRNSEIFNVGSENGYTVLEMIKMMEAVSRVEIPYKFTDRRPGDIGHIVADCSKARVNLKWQAEKGLEDMCVDWYRWTKNKHS